MYRNIWRAWRAVIHYIGLARAGFARLGRRFARAGILLSISKHISRYTGLIWVLATVTALIAAFVSTVQDIRLPVAGDNGSVARVNGIGIDQREYARALSAMQAGLKRPLTPQDEARALALLINEELIVQQAIELGLAREDRLIRKNLVQAMMRSVTALDRAQPGEKDLRALFETERQLFQPSPLFDVEALTTGAENTAQDIRAALTAGEAFGDIAKTDAVTPLEIPRRLAPGKLADILGTDIVSIITEMTPGDIAGPIPIQAGFMFIWLKGKRGGISDFETLRPVIEAEWYRRADERAFDAYAERLYKSAHITVSKK